MIMATSRRISGPQIIRADTDGPPAAGDAVGIGMPAGIGMPCDIGAL
jgi:hypothetical protein